VRESAVANGKSLISKYAPVWGLLIALVLLFVYVTMPSVKMNRYLNRVRAKRIEEIDGLRRVEQRLNNLKHALEDDPITIENRLRRSFAQARRMGEEEIEAPTR